MKCGELPRCGPRLYDAVRFSLIGIALGDLEERPLYVNLDLCSMLGLSEETLCTQRDCTPTIASQFIQRNSKSIQPVILGDNIEV